MLLKMYRIFILELYPKPPNPEVKILYTFKVLKI